MHHSKLEKQTRVRSRRVQGPGLQRQGDHPLPCPARDPMRGNRASAPCRRKCSEPALLYRHRHRMRGRPCDPSRRSNRGLESDLLCSIARRPARLSPRWFPGRLRRGRVQWKGIAASPSHSRLRGRMTIDSLRSIPSSVAVSLMDR
jgi:hypothetical protein